jgi:hypothetical protein
VHSYSGLALPFSPISFNPSCFLRYLVKGKKYKRQHAGLVDEIYQCGPGIAIVILLMQFTIAAARAVFSLGSARPSEVRGSIRETLAVIHSLVQRDGGMENC